MMRKLLPHSILNFWGYLFYHYYDWVIDVTSNCVIKSASESIVDLKLVVYEE